MKSLKFFQFSWCQSKPFANLVLGFCVLSWPKKVLERFVLMYRTGMSWLWLGIWVPIVGLCYCCSIVQKSCKCLSRKFNEIPGFLVENNICTFHEFLRQLMRDSCTILSNWYTGNYSEKICPSCNYLAFWRWTTAYQNTWNFPLWSSLWANCNHSNVKKYSFYWCLQK